MYYVVYVVTNTKNNKKFIGKHATDNIADNYIGSGILLDRDVDKYGRDCFSKEILFIYEQEELMNWKYTRLVNESVLADDMFYNTHSGGLQSRRKKIATKLLERSNELSLRAKRRHANKTIGMYGKKHSAEARRKISIANRGKTLSPETREKISKALEGRTAHNKGKRMEEWIEPKRAAIIKQAISNRNKKTHSGEGNPMYGKRHSNKTREQLSKKAKQRKKHACIHCGREMPLSSINRWHNDNCKLK